MPSLRGGLAAAIPVGVAVSAAAAAGCLPLVVKAEQDNMEEEPVGAEDAPMQDTCPPL